MALGSVPVRYYRLSHRGANHRGVSRTFVSKCLIAPFALLVVLAYADPPDPSWISGIYDDGDYDDVVGLVTDGIGVGDSQALWRFECVAKVIPLYAMTERVPRAPTHGQIIRGPPTKTCDLFDILFESNPSRGSLIVLATMTFSLTPQPRPSTWNHAGYRLTSEVAASAPAYTPSSKGPPRFS
jgi:hypothetical protein